MPTAAQPHRGQELARITIEDVAKHAGVSIKTVSRVLNKEVNVREQTRTKVQAAIDELKYQPDPVARRLAGSRSFLIGLLYDSSSAGGYITDVQGGVLKQCRAEHYELLIHPCDPLGDIVPEIDGMIGQLRIDGIVLTPPLCDSPALLEALRKRNIPFVSIAPGEKSYASGEVHTNDREACAEMTSYLASLGHEKIGFVIGHPDHKAVGNRYLGYRDGLDRSGLEFNEKMVAQGYSSFESGVDCGILLLRQHNPPTAIFASNDEMAAGIVRVASQLGMKVPDDLSVVGFDDIALSRQLTPPLTTIRQPIREMAETATQLLLSILRGEQSSEAPMIPCLPQYRGSTKRRSSQA